MCQSRGEKTVQNDTTIHKKAYFAPFSIVKGLVGQKKKKNRALNYHLLKSLETF